MRTAREIAAEIWLGAQHETEIVTAIKTAQREALEAAIDKCSVGTTGHEVGSYQDGWHHSQAAATARIRALIPTETT